MNSYSEDIVDFWLRLEAQNLNKNVFIEREILYTAAEQYKEEVFDLHPWRESVYAKNAWAFASQEIFANCFNAHFNVFDLPDAKYAVANPNDSARPFTGAFAMQYVIHRFFGETIPHSADLEKHVRSPRSMAKFFGGMVPIPSPELKQECGENFIANLENRYQGNPLNLLEEAMADGFGGRKVLRAFNSGKGLVELLVRNFGTAYLDTQNLEINGVNYSLHFNKRAQLLAVMLHARAMDSGGILPLVEDIGQVGPIADYELPKALRSMGILKYSDELASLVDNWKEIPKDSLMEIELRAATVFSCDLLQKAINRNKMLYGYKEINICHLDYRLWKMGKNAKHLRPHLTRTSAY